MSNNPVKDLALFFIRDIIGRRVTPADFRGRHMRAASILIKMGYNVDDLEAALVALKTRDYAAFGYDSESELPSQLGGMELLWSWGEPPLIERFLTPPDPPPVYSWSYDRWVEKWGRRAIEIGMWDGIYVKQDPESCRDWLVGAVGDESFEKSVEAWQTLQETSSPRKR